MLAKKQRLNRTEFSVIFKTGLRFHSQNLTIIHKQNETFKCSVVVSKKVARKSHDRNSIKRRLYNLIKKFIQINNWQGRVIFVVKPTINKLTKRQFNEQLTKEIAQVLNKT